MPSHHDAPPMAGSLPSVSPIYLALSKLRISAEDNAELMHSATAWRNIGFDLDRACTQSPTCVGASQEPIRDLSCQPKHGMPADGNQCRDNMFGRLMPLMASSPSLGQWFGVTEADWNCELRRGGFSVLFKISDYDGQPHDPSVRVDLYASPGAEIPAPWTCRAEAGGQPDIRGVLDPTWPFKPPPPSGWKIARSSLADPEAAPSSTDLPSARAADPHAYVRNGYLFASFGANTEFWLNGMTTAIPGFRFVFSRAILTGRLARDPTWSLRDATLGGVMDPERAIAAFREIGVCENMCSVYTNLSDAIRANIDVTLQPSASAHDPCTGISWGATLEAHEARTSSAYLVDVAPPSDCAEPRHSQAPRQGFRCTD